MYENQAKKIISDSKLQATAKNCIQYAQYQPPTMQRTPSVRVGQRASQQKPTKPKIMPMAMKTAAASIKMRGMNTYKLF